MIICGDMIDKGPDSVRLAQFIFQQPNIQCIMGNHEYAFLKRYEALMKVATNNFDLVLKSLQEYFPNDGYLLDWDTVDKFEQLPYYIEEKEYVCVHAGIPLGADGRFIPWDEVSIEQLVYDRNFKEPNVLPNEHKCVFFGHTPASYVSGEDKILRYPRIAKPTKISDYYKIHLDMGTMSSGIVGCICMDTGEEYYVG